jgi:hypothetical protein
VGATLRANVFGFLVAQVSAAKPLDRPGHKGWVGSGASRRGSKAAGLRLESLERALIRIDDPVARDAHPQVEIGLVDEVASSVAGRGHLADPVGLGADRPLRRRLGHARGTPAREVRHHDFVWLQLDVGLDDQPPASGAAAALIERIGQIAASTPA